MDRTDKAEEILKAADEWEIYISESDIMYIDIDGKSIEHVSSGKKFGVGIRAAIGNRLGFSFTDNKEDMAACAKTAIAVAKVAQPDADFSGFAAEKGYPKVVLNQELLDYGLEEFSTYMDDFNSILKSTDKRITAGAGNYKKETDHRTIINSNGVRFSDITAKNSVTFESMRFKDISLGFGEASAGRLDAQKAEEFGARLLAMQGKQDTKTGKADILFHPEALGPMIDVFVNHNFSAENIDKGMSGVSKETQLGEKLTLSDDPTSPGLFETRAADDEGVPTRKVDLIREGTVKEYLFDNYYARKFGAEPGNAARTPFTTPGISTSNLMLKPGSKEASEGDIYVKGVMGVHTMNPTTGEFSLVINEGEATGSHPLKNAMISGDMFGLLQNIERVGKEVLHSFSGASVYLPHVLVRDMQVIGKK